MKASAIQKMTASALLIAVGIVVPLFMPIRVVLEPASFTLASHVAIFLAMMLSPAIAVAVSLGTTIGFFFGGFPIVVVYRAATHLIFAVAGAVWLKKAPYILASPLDSRKFSLAIGLIHAAAEVMVVGAFYFGGSMGSHYYEQGFLRSVMLLVGVGSAVHSMVDFELALVIYRALGHNRDFVALQR